jgi:Ca2+-binding RTX toxin-like protein
VVLNEANGVLPKAHLSGGTGGDTLVGGDGVDVLDGGLGSNVIIA